LILIKENKGVTLIELMVALVIAAVLVAGTYSIFISQQRTYVAQDQIVGAQQDGRAALTIMARDIRMAGMLTGVNGFSNCTRTANQVYGYSDAINPNNNATTASTDQITVVYAAEEFITGGGSVSVSDVNNNTVTLGFLTPGSSPATYTNISSSVLSAFFNDSTKNYVAFEGTNAVYQIASGGVGANTLILTTVPPNNLATFSARVFRVRAITYGVNTSNYTLVRNDGENTQTLAGATNQSQVEDLQISYWMQGCTSTDLNTCWYNTPAEAGKTNAAIRAVRINLTMRTPIEDTTDRNYSRPTLEDHTGSATMDGYRRRVYTTVVKLRNF
jgi:prepilin-type N-terminal cleavage/methylation domain-containing protein